MHRQTTFLSSLVVSALAAGFSVNANAIIRCEMNGKSVNPSNGFETSTLTGMLRCRDEDSGKLQREEELRDGKYVGLQRFFDRDGKLSRERSVNERGNSHGSVKEFWPNGQLKSEETADNGQTVGIARRYFENGKLARITFYQDRRSTLEIGFNPDGSYAELRCPATSTIPEDRKPCGFNGRVEDTVLQTAAGKRRVVQRWDQGKLALFSSYRDDGSLQSEMSFDQGRRLHRSYQAPGAGDVSSGKALLREERVYEPGDQALAATAGHLQSSRQWGSNGQMTEQIRYSEGRPVQTERWYLNGARKEKSVVSGAGATARTQRENFADDGKLMSRETLTADGANTGLLQQFYASGKLRSETTFGEPDARGRTRVVARREWDESGKLVADDEILEDGSRKRRL